MNNPLLEEKVIKTSIFIKGTDIEVFGDLDSLDEDSIERIKESISFLLENNKMSTDKYVSVESEGDDWGTIKIYDSLVDENAESYDYCYYRIVKGKRSFINDVNEWTGGKYKTEEEILNCEELQEDVHKIRKGLYLIDLDALYSYS